MKPSDSKRRFLRGFVSGAVGWALGCSHLIAAVANVSIVNYSFSPASVTIKVNDQVKWNWAGNYHSTTSDAGLWDSGINNAPHAYSYTFTAAGTFPYSCIYHGFTGSVTVQAPILPPTVAITNPPTGVVLSAPGSLTLQATAGVSSGNITNVHFFQGTTSLGSKRTAPYSIQVTGLPVGSYTFSAVATDDSGLSATNLITVQVLTPAPITFSAAQRVSGTNFQFNYAASAGLRYVVQRSGNLKNWIAVDTNLAASTQVLFRDNNASAGVGFYRVVLLPNP